MGGVPYLRLYKQKMAFWGAYLLSQWGVGRAVDTSQVATMHDEAAGLRAEHGMSVPTEAALRLVGKSSPVAALGAGALHWAPLLTARGCDVLADAAAASADRALLLVWPDEHGAGTIALGALQAYQGSTLLLVGEWRGRTLTGTDGAAFAPDFQRAVEAGFEMSEQVRLPSWAPFLDALAVWRRRA